MYLGNTMCHINKKNLTKSFISQLYWLDWYLNLSPQNLIKLNTCDRQQIWLWYPYSPFLVLHTIFQHLCLENFYILVRYCLIFSIKYIYVALFQFSMTRKVLLYNWIFKECLKNVIESSEKIRIFFLMLGAILMWYEYLWYETKNNLYF